MPANKRRGRTLAIGAWFAIVLASSVCLVRGIVHAQTDDDPVVADVNGTKIYRSAVREIVKGVIAASPKVPDSAEIDRLTQDALDSLIDLELLYQEAQARRISVSDDEVEVELDATREQFTDQEEFEEALAREGLTEVSLRADTRKTLLVSKLLDQVLSQKVNVPDSAVMDFYRQNRSALEPGYLRVRQILISVPEGASSQDREEALLKIKQLHEQLTAGADFAQMAGNHSDDSESARRGGEIGALDSKASDIVMRTAQGLAPGEISAIIETPEGYRIVQLFESQPAARGPDEAMQRRIRTVLEDEGQRQQKTEFVTQLRKRARITFVVPTPAEKAETQPSPSVVLPEPEKTPGE